MTTPIKRTNLQLFQEEKVSKKSTLKQRVQHFKKHAELYGKAFLVMDTRGCDLKECFRHESSQFPPALSSEDNMNSYTKTDLLVCILDNIPSS